MKDESDTLIRSAEVGETAKPSPGRRPQFVALGPVDAPPDHRSRRKGQSWYRGALEAMEPGHGTNVDRAPQTVRKAVRRFEAETGGARRFRVSKIDGGARMWRPKK